jgi:hypothetical protein
MGDVKITTSLINCTYTTSTQLSLLLINNLSYYAEICFSFNEYLQANLVRYKNVKMQKITYYEMSCVTFRRFSQFCSTVLTVKTAVIISNIFKYIKLYTT